MRAGGIFAGNGRQNHKFEHTKVVYRAGGQKLYTDRQYEKLRIDLEWPRTRDVVTWTLPNDVVLIASMDCVIVDSRRPSMFKQIHYTTSY